MFTKDKNFIIKTITIPEKQFLMNNIEEYYQHLKNNKKTLLVKFFGLFSCKFNNSIFHFVIMNNLFGDMKMDLVFDLKGSKVGRHAKVGESVLKDNDILDLNVKLNLSKNDVLMFVNQIISDSQFLEKMNIMDYSLLLGFFFSFYNKKKKVKK
jgi:1-phosphatidylinositol-4-phosphate 5-kinase